MSNAANHNCSQTHIKRLVRFDETPAQKTVFAAANTPQFTLQPAVILSEAKDLRDEAWGALNKKSGPKSYEGFLAPLGMTREDMT
jgi:hypothetical protein